MRARSLEVLGLFTLVVAVLLVPTWLHGWPRTLAGNVFIALVAGSVLSLAWWRRPQLAAIVGLSCWLTATLLAGRSTVYLPDPVLPVMAGLALVLALGWSGRAAWTAGVMGAAYLLTFWSVIDTSAVAVLMFSVPGFAAGTVLRLRQETAEALEVRGRELEEERELYADLALRHERARIASELHDIVGHAISVMVVQAAAGQRLVASDPVRAQGALDAITASARQGRADLQRLLALLDGAPQGSTDLSLIGEVVASAVHAGLEVSCRFEYDGEEVAPIVAHVAFRVVQESLTNALRHAPGAPVRVFVREAGGELQVRVENDAARGATPGITNGGRGLRGLRERVQDTGGRLSAGPWGASGWAVDARLPTAR